MIIKLKSLLLLELKYPLATGKKLTSYQGMEGWKGKLVYMSPDQFLHFAAPIPEYQLNKKSLKNIEYRILNQLPMDFLVLHIDMKNKKVVGHEGRHRAIISKKLGIEKVPVLIYTGSEFDRVPKWTPETHAEINQYNFKTQVEK